MYEDRIRRGARIGGRPGNIFWGGVSGTAVSFFGGRRGVVPVTAADVDDQGGLRVYMGYVGILEFTVICMDSLGTAPPRGCGRPPEGAGIGFRHVRRNVHSHRP
ncbi:hypothetical protein Skr01_19420 [Sphaerisporangium krabiense]|nr:hypothetical protein Skr01_19420 [Sphaerisporangium krabiense]